MKHRLCPLHDLQGLSGYTVCVCYRATHLDKAVRLRDGLKGLGVDTVMLSPDQYQQYADERELSEALQKFVDAGDACVVLHDDAFTSRWVRTEMAEACRAIGRVIFVYDQPWFPVEGYDFDDPAHTPMNVSLVVKHSTIHVKGWDSRSLGHLATQILNDPEEGWVATRRELEAMRPWITRNIKDESEMRKYARRRLLVDPRCYGKKIRDVVAFPSIWVEGKSTGADLFRWYATTHGRPTLDIAVSRGDLQAWHTSYLVPDSAYLRHLGVDWLDVLYTGVPMPANTRMEPTRPRPVRSS